jgi:hypothetical protein
MPHLPPAHHEISIRDSPNETRIKVKHRKCPGFEFRPHQVNDSLQSNQGIDHLVSHNTTSEQEHMILTTLYLAGAKNTDRWHARKGDF